MTTQRTFAVLLAVLIVGACYLDAMQEKSAQNSTFPIKNITYNGPLIPKNWTEVSILDDQVKIRFVNGSTRSPQIEELSSDHRLFLEQLQDGTVKKMEKLIFTAFLGFSERVPPKVVS